MKQREHVVFFRNACKMQIMCMISILTLQYYNLNTERLSSTIS